MDAGLPPVVAEPDSSLALNYQRLARKVAAMLYFGGKAIPSTILTVNEG